MTVYLGTLGRMIPIYSTPSAQIESEERYSFRATLEGGRGAQLKPSGGRTWSLNAQFANAADIALLQDFARGAWGPGPWIFLSAEAVNTNILTPRQAALVDREQNAAWANGGPVQVSDGSTAPASMLSSLASSWASVFIRLPVVPGEPVTWTAEVEGNGTVAPQIAMAFYDAVGVNLGGYSGTGQVAAGMQRVSVTATPPANATSVSVGIYSSVLRLARPQVTWTDKALPVFSDGRGCAAAVLHGVSENVVLTVADRTFMNAGFTVSEVM